MRERVRPRNALAPRTSAFLNPTFRTFPSLVALAPDVATRRRAVRGPVDEGSRRVNGGMRPFPSCATSYRNVRTGARRQRVRDVPMLAFAVPDAFECVGQSGCGIRGRHVAHEMERLTRALAGRYRLDRELGAGGMATVYLARDLRHRRLRGQFDTATRRFSSSNQFTTTLIWVGASSSAALALSIRNCWPSGDTS